MPSITATSSRGNAADARGSAGRPAVSLLDAVKHSLGDDFVRRAARHVGEDEAKTQAVCDLLLSAALRRIARKCSTREEAEALLESLRNDQVERDLLAAVARLSGKPRRKESDDEDELAAQALYGSRAGSYVLQIGTATGMHFDSVWKLAALTTPCVRAALAAHVAQHDLDAASLKGLLAREYGAPRRSHRPRLWEMIGASGSQAVDVAFDAGSRKIASAQGVLGRARATLGSRLALRLAVFGLVAAILLGSTVWIWLADSTAREDTMSAATAAGLRPVELPGGTALEVERGGAIDKLVAFLSSDEPSVGKVVVLDQMYFDAGTATLRSASRPQLAQLAAVLAAYPDVKIEIEATADGVANSEHGKQLAEERALAVRAALGALGVRSSRVSEAAVTEHGTIAAVDAAGNSPAGGRVELRVTSH